MDVSKPVQLAGVQFGNVLMNGAYIGSKTLEEVEVLVRAQSGAVVVGSISVKPRKAILARGTGGTKNAFMR
jgi:hypothetical protein